MARLAACLCQLTIAKEMTEECIAAFVEPDEDKNGEQRSELLENIDDCIGQAAIACQKAQEAFEDVNYTQGESEDDGNEEEE